MHEIGYATLNRVYIHDDATAIDSSIAVAFPVLGFTAVELE
jgi:hypothetical protein